MKMVNMIFNIAYRSVKHVAPVCGANSCITYFNGKWLQLPLSIWPGFRMRYESYIAQLLRQNLKQGDMFIDIGAHVGYWSLFAGKIVAPTGRVVACDASPPVFEHLSEASRYCSAVKAYNIGLGSKDAVSEFFAQGVASSASFLREVTEINEALNPGRAITSTLVQMRTLDSLLGELDQVPSVIKVDVEGYELEVLKGAKHTLDKHSCIWIVEVHPPQLALSGGTDGAVQETLAASGYSSTIVDRNPNSLYTIVARK